MDRKLYAKVIDLIQNQEPTQDSRLDMENAQFTSLSLISTTQDRITFTFNYPESAEGDHIQQIVFAPAYIRIDTLVSGETVSKTVALT